MNNLRKSALRGALFLFALLFLAVVAVPAPSFAADPCSKTYPAPVIKFDHTDKEGRIYLPVTNYASYSDIMGYNNTMGGYRTEVYIYDGSTNKYAYAFAAFKTGEDLQLIWVSSTYLSSKSAYIVLKDKLCNKEYKSNTVTWTAVQEIF